MSTVKLPKGLPIADVPMIDTRTGKITQPWREYHDSFDLAVRALIRTFGIGSTTVVGLPSAATVGPGARATVTDATATTFNSVVAGGGTDTVPVVSNGTDWLIG